MNSIKPGSFLIIHNNNKELLLQIRWSASKFWETHSFFWGGIEEWETPVQAMVREIQEELNFFPMNYKYIWKTINEDTPCWIFEARYIYTSHINIAAKDYTVLEWEWCEFITISEIKKMDFYSQLWLQEIISMIEDNI